MNSNKSIKTANPKSYEKLKQHAKNNRANPTYAEKIAWNMLRKNQLGVKFRRQHIIDNFIVDFVSLEHKLVIELDGDSHDDKVEYDHWRDDNLKNLGYTIIHISNDFMIGNGNVVEQIIIKILEASKTNPEADNTALEAQIDQLGDKSFSESFFIAR